MSGLSNLSLSTKSQTEGHSNSTSSPNQNGYEMAPWAIHALKLVQQNPSTDSPAKDKYICLCYFKQLLQKEHSWSKYSEGSSVSMSSSLPSMVAKVLN